MISYYTAILILCWMGLGTLCILVHENDRISRSDKRLFYLTYALVAFSALAEWCGVQLDGRGDMPRWMLMLVKCADYVFTPMAGGAVVQMHLKGRLQKTVISLLTANAVFQLVSLPFGWTVQVDPQNHYSHGPLFPVYMILCLLIIAMIVIQSILYGSSFKRKNRDSLYAAMLLLIVSIALQELPDGHRTAYLGMTMAAALMFIHYNEFDQLAADAALAEQRIQLMLSQIKPHFLFNALGSIEALCERDPQAARQATRKFSKYLRGNMNSLTDSSLIPFETELQHTQLYLELEQLRFKDALRVEYDIQAREFLIPPLTLEPIVENAVKHGVRMNPDGRGTVTVAAKEHPDRYELTITDDGPGFDPDAVPTDEPHIGIRNVRERLEKTCGGSLHIDSASGRGAIVTIVLPK